MRIKARSLLNFSTPQLWEFLTGEFTLIFDDGVELETNYKETLYSSYAWDFHREFPETPLLKDHHVQPWLSSGSLKADTHLKVLTQVNWATYEQYVNKPEYQQKEWELRKYLRRRVAETSNYIYNDLSKRCKEYTTSLDILDFIEVHEHPKVKQANETVFHSENSINNVYKTIQNVLTDPLALPDNNISKIMRAGIANAGQVNQCLGPRGFVTDIDSYIFKKPVLSSYLKGIHALHDSMIESRLASKSLIFSKEPLQQAEYFSRRLQLMNQVVQNLHMRDCGAPYELHWHVRGARRDNHGNKISSDLRNLKGKWYLKEDGTEDWIRGDEEHLIGKSIRLRSPVYCRDPDHYGVCSKCFGMLSFSVFDKANIGQYCWTFVAEKSTQSVLSVKHYDGSSVVDAIYIEGDFNRYIRVDKSGSSYQLNEKIKERKPKLIVTPKDTEGMNDVLTVEDIRKLNLSRVSEIDEIGLEFRNDIDREIVTIPVGMKGRRASFNYPFLKHIKEKGYTVDELNNYVIDLEGWNWDSPFLTLPLKHFNMSDHSAFELKVPVPVMVLDTSLIAGKS